MPQRMHPMETVRMALTTLRSNRLRSLLTMVGIVIGNASVITLVGVGRGAQGLAEDQLSNLGANVSLDGHYLPFYLTPASLRCFPMRNVRMQKNILKSENRERNGALNVAGRFFSIKK